MNRTIAVLLLALGLLLPFTAPNLPAQETGGKKAAKKDPGAGDGPLSAADRQRYKNTIRRQIQNSRIPQAIKTVEEALSKADPVQDRDLVAYASWGKSVLEGNAGKKDSCLEWMGKAVEHGWANPMAFQYAALIPDWIKEDAKFQEQIAALYQIYERELEKERRAAIAESLKAAPGRAPFPVPEGLPAAAGKPLLAVIARIHHDGFYKTLPTLRKIAAEFPGIPVVVLFHQYFEDDTFLIRKTADYVKELDIPFPHAVVDRDYMKGLTVEVPYFPTFLWLGRDRKPLFQEQGVIGEKYLRLIFAAVGEHAGPDAPEPAPPKPPAEEKPVEEKPAEKEPPAEKPADKPAEEKPAEEKPAEKKPAEKPAEEPGEKPSDQAGKNSSQ